MWLLEQGSLRQNYVTLSRPFNSVRLSTSYRSPIGAKEEVYLIKSICKRAFEGFRRG